MTDEYGSVLRERLKESMSEPTAPKFKPLNKRVEPGWWARHADLAAFLYVVAMLAVGVTVWLAFAEVEKWIR